ncbi:hypothetical protein ACC685_36825, partial [Rhizobium ruizarguesonis]
MDVEHLLEIVLETMAIRIVPDQALGDLGAEHRCRRDAEGQKQAPNLVALLEDPTHQKIFHYGRFDIAVLFHTLGVTTTPVFCTKIASRLIR